MSNAILAPSIPAGITVIGWLVVAQTLLQKWVPDRYMGRVFGSYEAIRALMLLAGMGLSVLLADFVLPAERPRRQGGP